MKAKIVKIGKIYTVLEGWEFDCNEHPSQMLPLVTLNSEGRITESDTIGGYTLGELKQMTSKPPNVRLKEVSILKGMRCEFGIEIDEL